ncbi:hypothetical protein PRIPAC_90213 [Pristionchus pacificus]|uniref:Uncharacterized protein n=1 Tax=Pristionchus pacificus TaxID=54126 RepID=A0A2A6B3Q4_PRIPA|nr:hypothetical protein PRIPAC_90213 [Pristionchus pacificus]|eukprot:PDM60510.1 hypothetical protein PRIPAC_53488 [Pristionchus pacificus]
MAGNLATVLFAAIAALSLTAALSIPPSYIEARELPYLPLQGLRPDRVPRLVCEYFFYRAGFSGAVKFPNRKMITTGIQANKKYNAQCIVMRQPEPEALDESGIRALCEKANCYPLECKIHYDDDFVASAKCLKRGKRC